MDPGAPGRLARDTTLEAEQRQVDVWRAMSSVDLAGLVAGASRAVRTLAFEGLRARHPDASEQELIRLYARVTLGPELADSVYRQRDTATSPGA